MKPPPYRLVLVGYGPRGRRWHDRVRSRRDVVVAGAVEPERAARAAARRAGLRLWDSAQEAAESAALQGAIIATPPTGHMVAVLACLHAGLAVLVEKPLALSLSSAATVVAEVQATGRPALVVQNFRFLDRERAMGRIGLGAAVGSPIEGAIRSTRPPDAIAAHVAGMEHGVLWDFALHHLDALRVRFGAVPERIDARIADGRVTADLWWATGTHIDYRHHDGAEGYRYQERLKGPGGAVTVDDQQVTVALGGGRSRRVRPGRAMVADLAVLDEFAHTLATGRPSALEAADNLLTIAVVEAATLSARLHRPVMMSEVASAARLALPSPTFGAVTGE